MSLLLMVRNLIDNVVRNIFTERKESFALLGAIGVLYLTLRLTYSGWRLVKYLYLARLFSLGVKFSTLGKWGVITGATDGIGKAYAEELARSGLNIVLISRSVDRLNDVAKQIESASQVETKVIAVDFTGGAEIYTRIERELSGLDIAVLVNNVGMVYHYPEYLGMAKDDQTIRDIINVNCNSVTFMTKIVLPGMAKKAKGAIINISSLSGIRYVPMTSIYSATKSYMETFSRCIRDEYRQKGIIVQNVAPGFVATKLARIAKPSLMTPSATSYVRSVLPSVGVADHTHGYLVHCIQSWIAFALPGWLYSRWLMSVMNKRRTRVMKLLNKKE